MENHPSFDLKFHLLFGSGRYVKLGKNNTIKTFPKSGTPFGTQVEKPVQIKYKSAYILSMPHTLRGPEVMNDITRRITCYTSLDLRSGILRYSKLK
uniref:Uncharacterized protein n=1 Tax=Glossina palpalis gambiensis TaxID=67801 RepID=A0A1B0B0J8_9MUSC